MVRRKQGVLLAGVLLLAAAVCTAGIMLWISKSRGQMVFSENKLRVQGQRYVMVVNTASEVRVTSLSVDGHETLGDGGGIHTGSKVEEQWFSSLEPKGPPLVKIRGNTAVIRFKTALADEEWQIKALPDRVDMEFSRTFSRDAGLVQQMSPTLQFDQDIFENIRWNSSGGNFWVGGKASAMKRFLAADSGYSPEKNLRRAMEDTSFTLLTGRDKGVALRVEASTSRDGTDRGAAVEVDRVSGEDGSKCLSLDYILSAPEDNLHYVTGSAAPLEGWPGKEQESGHVRFTGNPIYKSVSVRSGQHDTVSLSLIPDRYDRYYDLGSLEGIDEMLVSEAVNNYGRMMVLDADYGCTQENPNAFFEVPAIQQHWNVALATLTRSDGIINTLKNGLRRVRDGVQEQNGHIQSPYVWSRGDSWGSDYADMQTGYVLAVADLFSYTQDQKWVREMRDSVDRALQYEYDCYLDKEVWLLRNVHTSNPGLKEAHNDYWEKSTGVFNGYTTVMFYDALVSWAGVLREVYGEDAGVSEYEGLASKIREAVNRSTTQGGMWSDEMSALMYGSGNQKTVYLPPNAAALRAGLFSRDRARLVVERIERDNANFNLGFHAMNVRDLRNAAIPAPQDDNFNNTMLGENGGWYGAPDGDFFAGLPVYGDRNKIPFYIENFSRYFEQTGFVGGTTWKRDGITPADYGWQECMPDQVLPVWGLYTYAYGFQPKPEGLFIAPFINESMIGSQVLYRWAYQDLEMSYEGLQRFKLSLDKLPGKVVVRFVNQKPGAVYTVRYDQATRQITADQEGNVDVQVEKSGTHTYELLDPVDETCREQVNVALGKPVRASSVRAGDNAVTHWPEQVTDGDLLKGAWFAAHKGEAWILTDLGRKSVIRQVKLYFARTDRYSFRLEGSNDADRENWTVLKQVDSREAGPENPVEILDIPGEYQYLRVFFTGTASGLEANLRELEAGAVTEGNAAGAAEEKPADVISMVNDALKKPVTASSGVTTDQNGNWYMDKVNDGSRSADHISGGWSSAAGAEKREEWVQIDLQKVVPVERVTLYPRDDAYDPGNFFPVDYKLLLSLDGIQWVTAASVTDQPVTTDPVEIKFKVQQARYVRLLATRMRDLKGSEYYCQITELEVSPPAES